MPDRVALLDGWLTSGAKHPTGSKPGTCLPLADTVSHDAVDLPRYLSTSEGVASARLRLFA
ncbi:MAG: hypothetical protein ACLP0L_06340 [Solirubrobacteraceae bacterium]